MWYSNTDEQNCMDSSQPNEHISTRSHLERPLGRDAWQQSFEVMPTMTDDTFGTVYFDGFATAETGLDNQYMRYFSIIEHVTDYTGASQAANPDTTWSTSQHLFESAAVEIPAPFEQPVASGGAPALPNARASMPMLLKGRHTGTSATDFEHHNDPSPSEDGLVRRQDPRFAGDEYTAKWVRGDRLERAGWCSRCSTW